MANVIWGRGKLMGELVHEAHPELYHYTTAAGLKGIVESQQLWATNIAYLNDAEEHIGFFDRRFSVVLGEPIRAAIADLASSASGRDRVKVMGGEEKAMEELKRGLLKSFRSTTLKFNNPYVTAFCSPLPKQASNDGLLSQWRGYGVDGGYAIVFKTDGLNELLGEESKRFHYQSLFWGDVEYFDQDISQGAAHPETLEMVSIVQKAIRSFILTPSPDEFEPTHEPIARLSCLHKHSGFREEAEVRIVAMPSNNELLKIAQDNGGKRQVKPVHFATKNGVLVPYIELFCHKSNGNSTKLPISKIIVGPHPDRLKRQKAVELLLEQNKIEAQVMLSDIPYLGR